MHGLKDVRVVDCSTGLAGAYAGKLFADAGADVIKMEREQGDPLRHWSATGTDLKGCDGVLFRYVNASKRSIIGCLTEKWTDEVQEILDGADLIIEDHSVSGLHRGRVREAFPKSVLLTITPFGLTGPLARRAATDFTIQAEAGSLGARGRPGKTPFQAGGRLADWSGGSFAALAALAAVRGSQARDAGEHIDFSLQEVTALSTNCYIDLMWGILGRPPAQGSMPNLETPSIEPTKDGFVGFTTYSAQQMGDFLLMIGREDLRETEEFSQFVQRLTRLDEFERVVHGYTKSHETAEIVELAQMLRIPVAPILNGKTVLEQDQMRARGVYVEDPSGGFMRPLPPYRIDGKRPAPPRAAPGLGEHSGRIESHQRKRRTSSQRKSSSLPLEGLRIVDATTWWAGPIATQMLATLGADVIHVESIQRMDGGRSVGGTFASQHENWWESSFIYLSANSNKRGITLDLSSAEGLQAFDGLVKEADAVVENFSPRVMEGFGITWERIQSLNPRCHYVRMPAFGLDGPWRDYVGFAATMEQMSGLSWVTGHTEDQPRIQRGPCDPMAGVHAAFALLVALVDREETGLGHLVECSMLEAALNVTAEQVGEYSSTGKILGRQGNRSPGVAPQGLFACKGHNLSSNPKWIALSVASEAQWKALLTWLGNPKWAEGIGLSLGSREDRQDEIEESLRIAFAEKDLEECVRELSALDVPVSTVTDPRCLAEHPQFRARSFFEEIEHPLVGAQLTMTAPFRYASVPRWLRKSAPTLGQHNGEVLRSLGYSAEDLASLAQKKVIGDWPEGL